MNISGMLGALGEVKDDAQRVGTLGVAVFAGAAAAKIVVNLSDKYFAMKADSAGAKVLDESSAMYKYINPLIPSIVGVVLVNRLGNQYPVASTGLAAGMVSYTVGSLLSRNLGDYGDKLSPHSAPKNTLLGNLGYGQVDSYDSSLLAGLGQARYGGVSIPNYSVSRYMMAGAPTQIQSLQGAPTQIQSLMGAPTQIQSLMGAPTQIQSLNGAPTQVQTVSPAGAGAAATLV